MFIFLLISFIFNEIEFNFINNVSISIGVFIYSITFLLSFIIIRINIKDYKSILFDSCKYLLLFYLLIFIIGNLNIENKEILKIFLPNSYKSIIYPNIIKLIIFMLTFYFSHYIFYIIYEVSEHSSNYILGFILAILISFILDQMIYSTITTLLCQIDYKIYIVNLTNNFIITLLSSLILTAFCPIFKKITNK